MTPTLLSSLLLLLCLPQIALGVKERNVTVDDTDGSITYSGGGWETSAKSDLDFGGTHQLSSDGASTATFKFTGTAVYLISPKWPYSVNTAVQIDNGPKTTVDLVDTGRPTTSGGPETAQWSVVWSQKGLTNSSHTVVLSMANTYVVSDGFIYTQSFPDDAVVSSTSAQSSKATSSATASPAASSAAASGGSKNHTVAIAVGTVFGVLGVLLLVTGLLLWRRRQNKDAAPAPSGSSWEKNAFAPQYANGGGGASPSSSTPWVGGAAPTSYQGPPHAAYANAPPAVGQSSSNYGGYNAAGPAAGAAAGAMAADPHRNVPAQRSHPYGYAGVPNTAHPQSGDYGQYHPDQRNSGGSFNPYAPAVAAGLYPMGNASSSQTHLRPQNLNHDARQSNAISGGSSQLAYTSGESDAGGSSSNGAAAGQPGYLTSQQEKQRLYHQHNAQDANPASTAPSPPAYSTQ